MRLRRPFASAVLVASLSVFGARTAAAQSPAEIQIARQTAEEGLRAYKAGDFEKAVALFDQARAVYPSAQILRLHGYSHLALQHWVRAVDVLEAALDSKIGPLSDEHRKDTQDNLAKALAHLGKITVTTKVKDAELVVDDGRTVSFPLAKPLRLLEGKHKLTVRAPGHLDAMQEIAVEGGKDAEVAIEPELKEKPAPPPPPPKVEPPPPPKRTGWFPHQRTVGFAAAGVGVGAAGVALVTAIAGAGLRGRVEKDIATHNQNYGQGCAKGDVRLCQFDVAVINQDADHVDTLQATAIGFGIAAGVLVAGGVVLVATAPKQSEKTVACGPAGMTGLFCRGTF